MVESSIHYEMSLHIRSFWKIHFINPPEVQGQIVRAFFYGQDNDDANLPKIQIRVNMKIAGIVPFYLAKIPLVKRISIPPFPAEIYTVRQNLPLEELRKKSLFSLEISPSRRI